MHATQGTLRKSTPADSAGDEPKLVAAYAVCMAEQLLTEIQRRRGDMENADLVSKLPPENLREADLVLGILFNGWV